MENYTEDELEKINKNCRLVKKLKKFEFIFYVALISIIIYLALDNIF